MLAFWNLRLAKGNFLDCQRIGTNRNDRAALKAHAFHWVETVKRTVKNGGEQLVVPQEGLEPPTPSLRMTCSTN
jgi:hypothetical protein